MVLKHEFCALMDRELAAAHESIGRKEAALDAHGYGASKVLYSTRRFIKGSVFVEGKAGGNASIGLIHSQALRGAGLLWSSGVTVERNDVMDLAHCLMAFNAVDQDRTAGRLGVRIEEDV